MKMKLHRLFLYFIVLILFSCVNDSSQEIKNILKTFLGTHISLSNIDLIPFQLSDSISVKEYIENKYKIITYVDSVNCSECKVNLLRRWPEIFRESNTA